jgi:hypothetical protein
MGRLADDIVLPAAALEGAPKCEDQSRSRVFRCLIRLIDIKQEWAIVRSAPRWCVVDASDTELNILGHTYRECLAQIASLARLNGSL